MKGILTWKCKECGKVNKSIFEKLDWNFNRGRCGDVNEVFFFLYCAKCNRETILYTKPYDEN